MVGIVAVSHSPALARAAVDFALTMVHDRQPRIAIAAGVAGGDYGTDATRVAAAIAEVADDDGALVLCDLGSAVLSAEMGIELSCRDDVTLVDAPFTEGLFAAVVAASLGATREACAAEACGALAAKRGDAAAGTVPETAAGDTDSDPRAPEGAPDALAAVTVVNPLGIHARPAARIAELAAPFRAKVWMSTDMTSPVQAVSPTAVLGLDARKGDRVWIEAFGSDATAAVQAVKALIAEGFGEAVPDTTAELNLALTMNRGIGLSPGRVVGKVLHALSDLEAPEIKDPLSSMRREAEAARIPAAARAVAADLKARAKDAHGTTYQVLQATAVLAEDRVMHEDAMARVRLLGERAERAVWEMMAAVILQYERSGGMLAERASDLRDLRSRIVAKLSDTETTTLPLTTLPHVLVADDVSPVEAAELDPRLCLGLVLGRGGPTSHTTIIARSLGIPVVIHPEAVATLHDGQKVLLDGRTGELIAKPSPEEAATARSTPLVLADLAPASSPITLRDGTPVPLLGNIGGRAEAAATVERGGSGVGLFRTEYIYLDRQSQPTLEEQTALYADVLQTLGGNKVVFRTLDAGSDKPLAFLQRSGEANPALGVRGIRTVTRCPEVLDTQLEAIAAAAERVPGSQPWVMAPMVATTEEAVEFTRRARAFGLSRVGMMVETPAAAVMTDTLLGSFDFVSIGTNDLTQYTLAADRLSAELSHLNTPWQPSVLRLVHRTVSLAPNTPVSVCGEAASDPLLAGVLLGFGVHELSMTPAMIPVVAEALRGYTLEQCRAAAAATLTASTAAEAREAAAKHLVAE